MVDASTTPRRPQTSRARRGRAHDRARAPRGLSFRSRREGAERARRASFETMTSARRTMGVEDDEDATTTGRGARSSTLSLVAMSAMAMLASGAATVGVRRVIDARGVGTGGRGTSLAALGQRMDAA